MAARPFPAVPFIINSQASPIPVTDLDSNYAQLLTDFNDSAIGYVNYAADIGIANAYVLNLASAPSAYVAGMSIAFVPGNTNGAGASTINVNSLGGVNITDANAGTPQPGMIKAGMMVIATYDGTQFRIATLTELSIDLGNMNNPSLNCAGYKKVWIMGNMNGQANTLTLTNVNYNTDLQIYVVSNNNFVFKIAASTPASINYSVFSYWNAPAGAHNRINMTTTGYAAGGSNIDSVFRGVTGTQGGSGFLPLVTQSG